ncbi:MAG: acyl transferase [Bacteroidetes bacterium GWF2_38_335]|nr:MAG: acyl transferase [Bacteroidetes bacterium GWF2_38_335]OFY76885.1 MAG: acyl transferase [Bacteroidetes bacterium RIFOXYA12_FULL_38_20]HBS86733.1 acyl transferase [Bacteroidales bacterium]
MKDFADNIFNTKTAGEFERLSLGIFNYQFENNQVYRRYAELVNKTPKNVSKIVEIPFLPIEFFKTQKIITGDGEPEQVFLSSGTTGQVRSRHFITNISLYEKSFYSAFRMFYGEPEDYCILALLPSYLEREGSSLIYMVEKLISESGHPMSGFHLYDHEALHSKIQTLKKEKQKNILFGVSYALLDFAENFNVDSPFTIIMETGGMKGKRREMPKEEMYDILKRNLKVEEIHSEYGMTELLSQAYSKKDNRFFCPETMKILIRDTSDPFAFLSDGQTGGINIVDLANINSCSFIETKDLGKKHPDGSFEVLGRFEASDIRGCNLLVAE